MMVTVCIVEVFKISIQLKMSFKNLDTVHIKVAVPFRKSAKYTAMNVKGLYATATECCYLDWRGH